MDSYADRINISVCLSGGIASGILDQSTKGRIAAVFKSSFYIETEAGYICIGNEDFEPAPLNLVTEAPAGTDWSASGLRQHDKVCITANTIGVANRINFKLSNSINWSPSPISQDWTNHNLRHGLKNFRKASVGRVTHEGLGPFLTVDFSPNEDQSVCRMAEAPIAQLQAWLGTKLREPKNTLELELNTIQPLIGLGPGLTPSGDDVIGGMMLALQVLGQAEICMELWDTVKDYAMQASNSISVAHMDTASKGNGCAAIHQAISAILDGRSDLIRASVPCIDRIGHTSGWDTMAGVIIALDAWQQARISSTI